MGCGASKPEDTAVIAAAPPRNATTAAKTPAVTSTPPRPEQSSAAPASSLPRPTSNGSFQELKEGERMVCDLNDVVPMAGGNGRGRFLSYASGASTPNTSQGNLSWDGDETTQDLSSGSGHHTPTKGGGGGKKMLKHSSSALGLDELHTEAAAAGLTSKLVHIEVPFGKPIEEVYDGVHNGPVLGSGVSGLVRLVTHKATGVNYAVKCLDLGLVGTKEGLAQLREEIFIMCQLDHPNIVRLEEVYESHSEIYLVQELCLGGELFDRLDEQPDYHYTEGECARLVKQMLSAVRYLHSKGIIHRDLKLENFLFSSKATDSELKMIDFGLSTHFQFGEVHHEAVGTPYTVAPEVIKGSYDERCDIWAIGVITFLLLSGDPPFGGCGGPEPLLTVRANILSCNFEFEPDDIWNLVSSKAKDFVKSMLVVDPQSRPTAREAQKHEWLRFWASRQSRQMDNVLNPNVVKALVNFKEFSDMRKLLSEVLSFTLLPDQIKELRMEFEKMDTDGSGEISLAALKQVLMTNAGAGSLGALTEEEVEDIFNAMRVNKSETRIHWHEFIAAGLSQCQVDDRNLRLAFDRLDSDHKGYITLDDIMHLAGGDELNSQEQVRAMWKDSIMSVQCAQTHIGYDDFVLLMKGQNRELASESKMLTCPPSTRMKMSVVPEGVQMDAESTDVEDGDAQEVVAAPSAEASAAPSVLSNVPDDNSHFLKPDEETSVTSLPNMVTQAMYGSSSSSMNMPSPGTSPANQKAISEVTGAANAVPDIKPSPTVTRQRSKSLADEKESVEPMEASPSFTKNVRRAIAMPERNNSAELSNKSALVVNRQLYRAHRQMRLAVLEASRRFEEQQVNRARDALMALKEQEAGLMGAGLVMRHGNKKQVTSDAIRKYLEESRLEQQQLVEKANRRGGRGRTTRKKTISDMSAMMNPSMGQDELGDVAAQACRTPDVSKSVYAQQLNASLNQLELPSLPGIGSNMPAGRSSVPALAPKIASLHPNTAVVEHPSMELPSLEVIDKTLRKATVPGQFRQTQDPFGADGMYGGSRISDFDVKQISTKEISKAPKHTK